MQQQWMKQSETTVIHSDMYVKDCIKCKELNTLVDIEYIAVTIVLSPCMTFTVVGTWTSFIK